MQILNKPNLKLPNYVKPPYLNLEKNIKKYVSGAIQKNIAFCETLEKMFVCAKFMKELLSGK